MKNIFLLIVFIFFGAAAYALSPQDFEEEFVKCTPGASTIAKLGGLATYRYEIVEYIGGHCVVESNFLKNPNPDYLNKEMKCAYDNTKPFMQAVQDMDKCSGELYLLLTGQVTSSDPSPRLSSIDQTRKIKPALIIEDDTGTTALFLHDSGRTSDGTFSVEYRIFLGADPIAAKLKLSYKGQIVADSIYSIKKQATILYEDDDYKVSVGYK